MFIDFIVFFVAGNRIIPDNKRRVVLRNDGLISKSILWVKIMIRCNEKYGCLTVIDSGDEYVNTELYMSLRREVSEIQDIINQYIDELKAIKYAHPEQYEAWQKKNLSACGTKLFSKLQELRWQIKIEKQRLQPFLYKLEKHYKCKCKCGKIHYYNEETIESNPKYCFYPVPISTKHTYSIKAQNATYRKEQKYAKKENVVLLDKTECIPSEIFCDRYNDYKNKQLLKNEEKLRAEIAAIPREKAKNYDVDYTGLQYESLYVGACVNDHLESQPRFGFSQRHNKIWSNIIVYKQYRCKCKLCGEEQLVTCDRFGIYPPTEYGFHAYYGYWSDVYCKCHEVSSFQWLVCKILIERKVNYEVEFSFPDLYGTAGKNLLRFDFAIFDNAGKIKYLIECQGEQHYKPVEEFGGGYSFERQKANDELKREYACKHNIPLLEIPYSIKKYDTIRDLLISKHIINE